MSLKEIKRKKIGIIKKNLIAYTHVWLDMATSGAALMGVTFVCSM
jgi:hypothetical protein